MNTRLLRRRPTRRINTRSHSARVRLLPPIHEQRDCVFCLSNTSQVPRCARTSGRRDFYRRIFRNHTLADIDVVRVEVVRDITILTSPGFESLKLEFGLTHVAIEIVEVSQLLGFGARIGICRVEAFVVLDEDEDAVFA